MVECCSFHWLLEMVGSLKVGDPHKSINQAGLIFLPIFLQSLTGHSLYCPSNFAAFSSLLSGHCTATACKAGYMHFSRPTSVGLRSENSYIKSWYHNNCKARTIIFHKISVHDLLKYITCSPLCCLFWGDIFTKLEAVWAFWTHNVY